MNSKVLTVLAILLFLGAVFVGYMGYQLSRQPAPVVALQPEVPVSPVAVRPEREGRVAVVFAARTIAAGSAVTQDDLVIEYLLSAPAQSFTAPNEIVGRVMRSSVAAGDLLTETKFVQSSTLARVVRKNERAIAIAVDDVVGAGGFISPGDYVDVLLYLRPGQPGVGRDSAQVLLENLRVLSYGIRLDSPDDGDAGAEEAKGERRNSRTAVLAIPESQVSRLMLASSMGTLRLAVRSADERIVAMVQSDMSLPAPTPITTPGPSTVATSIITADELMPKRPAPTKAKAAPRPSIMVHRGGGSEKVTP